MPSYAVLEENLPLRLREHSINFVWRLEHMNYSFRITNFFFWHSTGILFVIICYFLRFLVFPTPLRKSVPLECSHTNTSTTVVTHAPLSTSDFIEKFCLSVEDEFLGILKFMLSSNASTIHERATVVAIYNGHLYVKSRQHLERNTAMYINTLWTLLSMVNLPNVILPFNKDDFPKISKGENKLILSFCVTENHEDVLVPYGIMGEGRLYSREEYHAWVRKPLSMIDTGRSSRLYWRGSQLRFDGERGALYLESLRNPDKFELGFFNWDPPGGRRKSFLTLLEASRKYKYFLWIPGNCGSLRIVWQLLADVVVFRASYTSNTEKEWYDYLMIPFLHYIPVQIQGNSSNVLSMIEWAETHPEECERIKEASTALALKFFDRTKWECLWVLFLKEFSKRSPITRDFLSTSKKLTKNKHLTC